MHSNDIKSQAQELMDLADDPQYMQSVENRDALIAKALLLNVMTLNEVNWTLFYVKEELKEHTSVAKRLDMTLKQIGGRLRCTIGNARIAGRM